MYGARAICLTPPARGARRRRETNCSGTVQQISARHGVACTPRFTTTRRSTRARSRPHRTATRIETATASAKSPPNSPSPAAGLYGARAICCTPPARAARRRRETNCSGAVQPTGAHRRAACTQCFTTTRRSTRARSRPHGTSTRIETTTASAKSPPNSPSPAAGRLYGARAICCTPPARAARRRRETNCSGTVQPIGAHRRAACTQRFTTTRRSTRCSPGASCNSSACSRRHGAST